jgi:hypothetical protein
MWAFHRLLGVALFHLAWMTSTGLFLPRSTSLPVSPLLLTPTTNFQDVTIVDNANMASQLHLCDDMYKLRRYLLNETFCHSFAISVIEGKLGDDPARSSFPLWQKPLSTFNPAEIKLFVAGCVAMKLEVVHLNKLLDSATGASWHFHQNLQSNSHPPEKQFIGLKRSISKLQQHEIQFRLLQ